MDKREGQSRSIQSDQSGIKSPGRVEAMRKRWESGEEKWRNWRENLLELIRERKLTDSHRAKISEAKTGVMKPLEEKFKVSKTKGGIMSFLYPLFQREWFSDDVVRLGFERRAVTNGLQRMRRADLLKVPTKEQKSEAMRRSQRKEIPESERNSSALARKLIDLGIVPIELDYFNKLREVYRQKRRDLPANPADVLRLEVYLIAYVNMLSGEKKLMDDYRVSGESVNKKWFNSSLKEEEEFIKNMCTKKTDFTQIYIDALNKTSIDPKIKNAILVFLIYSEFADIEAVAKKLGISVDEAQSSYNLALRGLSEKHWDLMEDLTRGLSLA